MTGRTQRRSPLAVQLLLLLEEEPMHAYRMQGMIKERRKDRIVNIAQRNSVYQTLDRLLRAELITVHDTERTPSRPERTVYRITDAGRDTLYTWLHTMLATPAREFPEFPVALAALPALTPDLAVELLEARVQALHDRLDEAAAEAAEAERMGLPRLFFLEEEYRRAVTEAELRWVEGLLDDLRAGRLTWDREWLEQVSARLNGLEAPNDV
ncbi:DNA-binding PadR family transcriptional regulator [Lipingzhangella halophila]|uniref:DNA-binding PadR family transcriptional regulator n=1 Tax=Lipingzhangella halophila TaxID=1783352 RepID=A0A7W7RFI8_9ACTN|nr:helix-turn-helix transcriptional regulator [Lipingzhangella halophila]MBB4930982.1 DNA-binding PadR family transcriptional regulator [Lipingzhangella halophila]